MLLYIKTLIFYISALTTYQILYLFGVGMTQKPSYKSLSLPVLTECRDYRAFEKSSRLSIGRISGISQLINLLGTGLSSKKFEFKILRKTFRKSQKADVYATCMMTYFAQLPVISKSMFDKIRSLFKLSSQSAASFVPSFP